MTKKSERTVDGLTLSQHKSELRKWKSREVKERFEEVGSSLHLTRQTNHTVAINKLRTNQ